MYARPTLDGQPSTLGVSGMLWRDALIMYDRETNSLWSQVDGRAVAGPQAGQRLREIPSRLTTWGEWVRRHPNTLVLTKPPLRGSPYEDYFADPGKIGVRGSQNRDRRLPGKELVLGIEHEGRFGAVPINKLERERVMNLTLGAVPMLVAPSGAFDRRAGGRTLTFEAEGVHEARDRETSSLWSLDTGRAISGPLAGATLDRLSAKLIYWAIWSRFHPTTEVLGVTS